MENERRLDHTTGVDQAALTPPDQQPDTVGGRDEMPTPTTKRTTSPAFQFYPRDFLSSAKVDRMPMTERGAYITLLSRCWLDDGLPTDMSELAAMVRMRPSQFVRMWTNSQLGKCFYEQRGRFQHDRLDRERAVQSAYKRRQTDAANKRWQSHGNATAMPPHVDVAQVGNAPRSLPRSLPRSRSQRTTDSAVTLRATTPTALTFPTIGNGPKEWHLSEGQIAEWVAAYPDTDVAGECRRALAWAQANGFKTAKGMPAFLVGWLNRSVARGRTASLAATGTEGRGRTGAPPPGKYDGIEEHD
jgi:uncharacterized protein YdaU (DUF1376 family)